MGEKETAPFQFTFNGFLKVAFQGSRVTSDAGLILVRELDERLGLDAIITEHLRDSRQGLNTQFRLPDLLRQSVYSRLAGYEDLNDGASIMVVSGRVCPYKSWMSATSVPARRNPAGERVADLVGGEYGAAGAWRCRRWSFPSWTPTACALATQVQLVVVGDGIPRRRGALQPADLDGDRPAAPGGGVGESRRGDDRRRSVGEAVRFFAAAAGVRGCSLSRGSAGVAHAGSRAIRPSELLSGDRRAVGHPTPREGRRPGVIRRPAGNPALAKQPLLCITVAGEAG